MTGSDRPSSFCRIRMRLCGFVCPKNLIDSLRLMVFVLNACGLPPFCLTQRKAITRWSKRIIFGHIFSVILFVIIVDCFIRTIQFFYLLVPTLGKDHLFPFVNLFLVTSFATFAVSLVYISPVWKRYTLLNVIHIFEIVDGRLERLMDMRQRYLRTMLHSMKLCILNVILFGVYIFACVRLFSIYKHKQKWLYTWISYFLPQFILWQIVFKYLTMTELMRFRFASVNQVSV